LILAGVVPGPAKKINIDNILSSAIKEANGNSSPV
jgi:hypothetical protein